MAGAPDNNWTDGNSGEFCGSLVVDISVTKYINYDNFSFYTSPKLLINSQLPTFSVDTLAPAKLHGKLDYNAEAHFHY